MTIIPDPANPLMAPSSLPHGAPPFDKIKREHFAPAIDWALERARANIEAIRSNPDVPTFENTVVALEFCDSDLERVLGTFNFFTSASLDDEIEAIEKDSNPKISAFSNDVLFDEALFARIEAVYDMRDQLKLDAEEHYRLEKLYKSRLRSGAKLAPEQKDRLREISARLSDLATEYSSNLRKATQAYQKIVDRREDLAGVPERAIKAYAEAAEKAGMPGKFLIRLSPPPLDIIEHADNRELRRELQTAHATLGSSGAYDNRPIVLETVRLRHEKARILGYENYAAYVLEDRMAGNPETVLDFLERNREVYKKAAEAEIAELRAYAKQRDGIEDFQSWDYGYYSEKLKAEKFEIDMEAVRPYFELSLVEAALEHHLERLFNVETRNATGKYPVYHPDVTPNEVIDKATGKTLGVLYNDFYARPGAKLAGAWHSAAQTASHMPGHEQVTLNTNICNFDPPTSDTPCLLSWDQYRTIFHERGHAMHALLARGKFPSLTGTSVKRDFVETQSQLQEEWCSAPEVMNEAARHYLTGDPLPLETVGKLKDSENFDVGYAGLRQTFLALLDMKWHTVDPATIESVEAVEAEIAQHASVLPAAGLMSPKFSHLFAGGYAAGYYGYKWADVLVQDLFEDFRQNGLYDRTTARRLKETIYEPGGTRDAMELFVAMKGRKPDPDALYRAEGLLPADDEAPPPPAPKGPKPPEPGLDLA